MSSSFILNPEEVTPATAVGGKARALAQLHCAGFSIPQWMVLVPQAFEECALRQDPSGAWKQKDPDAFRQWVGELTLTPELLAELEQKTGARERLFAVRSSALNEDGAEHSFAGQLESYLFVEAPDIPRRIVDVWRSAFAERVIVYARERRIDKVSHAPAVIIQEMLESEVAGVAFSADPISGRRQSAVVSAVWGVGSGLVSGDCDADTWEIDRSGQIVQRVVATKTQAHRRSLSRPEGVALAAVSGEKQTEPCLSDGDVRAVAELARRCEAHFRRPQDIEWALARGQLFLLQSRPITSLATVADPDGAWNLWDNSNIAESYNGVTTPLTFSFARMAYTAVYEQFCKLMAVPARQIEQNRTTFRGMLGLIRGRIYYNLLNWYRVLALLPGFKVNRRFMEQMMGVKEPLPAHAMQEFETPVSAKDKLQDSISLLRTVVGLLYNYATVEKQIKAFNRRLQTALQAPDPPLAAMRPDQLAGHYHFLESELLLKWDAPLVNDFFAMMFFGVFRDLLKRWVGNEQEALANDLLTGEGGIISAEPAKRVAKMGSMATQHSDLVAALTDQSVSEIGKVILRHPDFAREYNDYLAVFGERCLEELKLETITLREDPLPLLRAIGHASRRATMPGKPDGLRTAAESIVWKQLENQPFRKSVFNWVLANTRARVKARENLRFERTRVFGRVRCVFCELGRRLAAEGLLENERDVFYLTVEEVLGFIEGTAVNSQLKALASLRQTEFAEFRKEPAPADRFETTGMVCVGNRFQARKAPAKEQGDERRGLGCCPGIVRGVAKVILEPRDAEIKFGEILVAPRTDPGWILLFPAAAGLLVEHGSLLSHSAIVSREMGIPAVVSIPGLTAWLKTGDLVEMDGSAGTVRKVTA